MNVEGDMGEDTADMVTESNVIDGGGGIDFEAQAATGVSPGRYDGG